jgi:hypothetical protein
MSFVYPSAGLSLRGTRVITESVHFPSTGKITTVIHRLYAGDRSRSESVQPLPTAFEIERRDLRQRIRVFVTQRKYQIIPLFDLATEQEKNRFLRSGRQWRKRYGTSGEKAARELNINFVYEATGEEQLMFGCTARRWIVRRRDEHDPGDGRNETEAATDAWYLDSREVAARYSGFSAELVHQAFCYVKGGDERAIIQHFGERPSGLCAYSETKSVMRAMLPNGQTHVREENSSLRIVSIAEESFPPSLFEPPAGFHEMPVYPSWLTIARVDLSRLLQRHSRTSA